MKEPKVSVGIQFEPKVQFVLHGAYQCGGARVRGTQQASCEEGRILWNGGVFDELLFVPDREDEASFELLGVTIGVNFHWERKETQFFQGTLKLIVEDEKITVINLISVEAYLTSVISSEMSATASLELLKAHAVISRSWLLAQIHKDRRKENSVKPAPEFVENENERIRWYDRDDHFRFDVCADDHCQRYQGITRASTATVRQAIAETRGEVLIHNKEICDARFSKCCGGVFEEFSTCWENVDYPYLTKQRDSKEITDFPDLRIEEEADRWIRSAPDAFCNTHDKRILGQVLNNYDQETTDFYRWKVTYSQEELSELISRRTGIDFGLVQRLEPVARGASGRLHQLRIIGSKRTMTIGKELEIRRSLSTSHLYSSAFVVDHHAAEFTLIGAGWGHGVGLCQIGAAVMGEQGYSYQEILLHYYPGASIEKNY